MKKDSSAVLFFVPDFHVREYSAGGSLQIILHAEYGLQHCKTQKTGCMFIRLNSMRLSAYRKKKISNILLKKYQI